MPRKVSMTRVVDTPGLAGKREVPLATWHMVGQTVRRSGRLEMPSPDREVYAVGNACSDKVDSGRRNEGRNDDDERSVFLELCSFFVSFFSLQRGGVSSCRQS